MFRAFNSRGQSDASYPQVAIRASSEYLELWNPATYSVHIEDSPPANAIIAINSGPYAGYRDQAAPFQTCSAVWFYWIWGPGPGLNTICSLRGPRQGPVFPAGYECYCPITEMMTDGNGQLRPFDFAGAKVFLRGSTMAWNPDDKPDPGNAEHFFEAWPWIPADALDFTLEVDSQLISANGCGASSLNRVGVLPGIRAVVHECLTAPAGITLPGASAIDASYTFPNISRGVYWDWSDFLFFSPNSVQHRWMTLYVLGYTLPA
jgi:hypothetical protein